MALTFPYPFPKEVAPVSPREVFDFGRKIWRQLQKVRSGQFSYSTTVTAGTVKVVTFTDVSVGGTDTGVDNTIAGMQVVVTPPSNIPSGLQLDYAFAPAAGKLTMQLRNGTAGDLAVAGTWSYWGFAF